MTDQTYPPEVPEVGQVISIAFDFGTGNETLVLFRKHVMEGAEIGHVSIFAVFFPGAGEVCEFVFVPHSEKWYFHDRPVRITIVR